MEPIRPTNQSSELLLSPYKCASRNGLWFGLYLSALYLLFVLMAQAPVLSLVVMAMAVGVPIFVYRQMHRDWVESQGYWTMAALWLDGLMTFLAGGVLGSFVLFVFLRLIEPDFLINQWTLIAEQMASSSEPQHQQFAIAMRTAISNGFIITPILFSMTFLWFVAFTGSIISLLAAIFIRRTRVRTFLDPGT